MTSPLANFVEITFVSTGDEPVEATPLNGQTFLFPPEYLEQLGSGSTQPGRIKGVRGYLDSADPDNLKWMMTGPITAAARTQILAIPGGLGWVDQTWNTGTPLRVFTNQLATLVRDHNVPGNEALTIANRMYDAASANRDAQIAAGG